MITNRWSSALLCSQMTVFGIVAWKMENLLSR
jgi:hypothetical protein